MPYSNAYSQAIASQVAQINRRHIEHLENVEQNAHDPTTQLEGMALKFDQVHGGSGYAAATVQDLGFEPTNGVTGSGVSGGGVSGGGVSGGGKKARKKKKKKSMTAGALLSLSSMDAMQGQPADTTCAKIAVKSAPHKDQPTPDAVVATGAGVSGGAKPKRVNARNAIVQQVMKERGLKLIEASKYVKEHGLYSK